MVDLSIKDANATGGGCNCGCGGHDKAEAPKPTCNCGSDCTCGCQDGKPCTCGEKDAKECNCGSDCTCGCQDGKPCTCAKDEAPAPEPVEGVVTAKYTVSGMTCGHCVTAIKEEVGEIPGVTAVDVDLESGAMTVASDAPVDFDRIVEAVAEAGDYTVE